MDWEVWYQKYLDSKKELAEFEDEIRRDLKKMEDEDEEAEHCKKELENNLGITDNQSDKQKSNSDVSLGNGDRSEIERWAPDEQKSKEQDHANK